MTSVLALACLFSLHAQADSAGAPPLPESRAVVVLPPRCALAPFSFGSFLDSLRVEVAGRGPRCCALGDPNDGPPATSSVRVELEILPCEQSTERVQVSAFDPRSAQIIRRDVSLADVTRDARPRALALVVAELIHSMSQGAPRPPQPPAPAAEARKPEPPPPAPAPRLVASARGDFEVRSYPSRSTTMWGGRLGVTLARNRLRADLDLGGGTGTRNAALGDVRLRAATAGLSLGPRFAAGAVLVDLGLRGEVGWAWVSGMPAQTSVSSGAGSGLVASAGFRLSLQGPATIRVRPGIALEGGLVAHGLSGEANGAAVAGIAGAYALVNLGLIYSSRQP